MKKRLTENSKRRQADPDVRCLLVFTSLPKEEMVSGPKTVSKKRVRAAIPQPRPAFGRYKAKPKNSTSPKPKTDSPKKSEQQNIKLKSILKKPIVASPRKVSVAQTVEKSSFEGHCDLRRKSTNLPDISSFMQKRSSVLARQRASLVPGVEDQNFSGQPRGTSPTARKGSRVFPSETLSKFSAEIPDVGFLSHRRESRISDHIGNFMYARKASGMAKKKVHYQNGTIFYEDECEVAAVEESTVIKAEEPPIVLRNQHLLDRRKQNIENIKILEKIVQIRKGNKKFQNHSQIVVGARDAKGLALKPNSELLFRDYRASRKAEIDFKDSLYQSLCEKKVKILPKKLMNALVSPMDVYKSTGEQNCVNLKVLKSLYICNK